MSILSGIIRYAVIINIIALLLGIIAKKIGYMKAAKVLSQISLIGISAALVYIAIIVLLILTGII